MLLSPLRGEMYFAVRVVPPGDVRVSVCFLCPPGVSTTSSRSGGAAPAGVSRGHAFLLRGFASVVVTIGVTVRGGAGGVAAVLSMSCSGFHLIGMPHSSPAPKAGCSWRDARSVIVALGPFLFRFLV